MPSYRCSQCGKYTSVPNTRGSQIKDHPCEHCDAEGTLQGATAGRRSKNAGRKNERCAACDRRGLDHAHPPFEWEPKYGYAARPGPFPTGSPACWREEPVPASRTRHATVHQELEARLGTRGHASAWASKDDQQRMGLPVGREDRWQDPRLRETCQICGNTPSRDEDGSYSHSISAYRFERGVAAVLVCEGCGHTRLLAELPDVAAQQGPDLDHHGGAARPTRRGGMPSVPAPAGSAPPLPPPRPRRSGAWADGPLERGQGGV